jgi:hypothetical protein
LIRPEIRPAPHFLAGAVKKTDVKLGIRTHCRLIDGLHMVCGGLDIWRIETTVGQSMMTADGNNLVPPIHPFLLLNENP